MDLSLIIFVVVSAYFVYRGYRKGLLRSLAGIVALAAGYVAVIFLVAPVGEYLQHQTGLQGFLPTIISALVLFIGAGIVIRILFGVIGKMLSAEDNRSNASAFGGAAIGLVTGVVVATLAVWGLNYVREMNGLGGGNAEAEVRRNPSTIEKFAGKAAGEAVGGALSLVDTQPEVSRLGKALIASPGVITRHIKRLSTSPELQQLFNDPKHQAALNSGDIDAVQALPAFRELVRNEDMQALAQAAGVIDEASGSMAGEAELAARFSDIWQRVQRVKDDDRVQAILGDGEFMQQLQNADPMALLGDSRVTELTGIIMSEEAAPPKPVEASGSAAAASPKAPPKKIFSWKDEQGRTHFTDEDPAQ
jgi:uncharacterized membrane protein required for colicin V production